MAFLKELRQALLLSLCLFGLCGLIYPYAVTGAAYLLAPGKAGGSLIFVNGQAVGSELIGQSFDDPRFMQGRPSAVGYNVYTPEDKEAGRYGGVASGSENLSPGNPALIARVKGSMEAFLQAHPGVRAQDIPADLVTASGSGLDPHISPAAARLQIPELARRTGLTRQELELMVQKSSSGKWGGIFGEDVVHVLKVNLAIASALGLEPGGHAYHDWPGGHDALVKK